MAKSRSKQNRNRNRNTTDRPSLFELATNPSARRRLSAQFGEQLRQNLLDVIIKPGTDHPLLSQFRPKDRK